MTDPFDVLRLPAPPVEPAAGFAARLRARIERALALPEGVSATVTTHEISETRQPAPPHPLGSAIPYLAVAGAREAIEWYVEVLGAEVAYDPIVMPDGRIGHAELKLAGGLVYLADEHPEIGVVAPSPDRSAVSLMLAVDDADAVRAAAIERGATGHREPYDGYGTRNAWIVDPFGHRWGLNSPLPAGDGADDAGVRHGDLVFASVQVADAERAATFYREVLGWDLDENFRVSGQSMSLSIYGTPDAGGLFTCYAVSDLVAAAERVRAAGGTAGEPVDRPYGAVVDCVDDQGTPFALNDTSAATQAPPMNGARAGDLAYVTHLSADSGRFRAFYGAVLGWTFSPGRVADGWEIQGTRPMAGMAGGNDTPRAVPMWRVDDLDTAIERIRAAGGTATDPVTQAYGRMSECTDDQETPFYLGQL